MLVTCLCVCRSLQTTDTTVVISTCLLKVFDFLCVQNEAEEQIQLTYKEGQPKPFLPLLEVISAVI